MPLNHDHRVLFNPSVGKGEVYTINTGNALDSAIAVAAAITKTTELLVDEASIMIKIQEYVVDELAEGWTEYLDEVVNREINNYLRLRVTQ